MDARYDPKTVSEFYGQPRDGINLTGGLIGGFAGAGLGGLLGGGTLVPVGGLIGFTVGSGALRR